MPIYIFTSFTVYKQNQHSSSIFYCWVAFLAGQFKDSLCEEERWEEKCWEMENFRVGQQVKALWRMSSDSNDESYFHQSLGFLLLVRRSHHWPHRVIRSNQGSLGQEIMSKLRFRLHRDSEDTVDADHDLLKSRNKTVHIGCSQVGWEKGTLNGRTPSLTMTLAWNSIEPIFLQAVH